MHAIACAHYVDTQTTCIVFTYCLHAVKALLTYDICMSRLKPCILIKICIKALLGYGSQSHHSVGRYLLFYTHLAHLTPTVIQ